ncbi:MAG: sigma-70 family RNA polymerase sigma factor [Bacillota bacterium]
MDCNLMKDVQKQQVQKIEDYMPTLMNYCRFLTKCSWDGEDIAQETVLKAIENYGHKQDVITPTLLKRIAYNHWIDTVRKRKKETLEDDVVYNGAVNDHSNVDVMEIVQHLIKNFTPKQAVVLFFKEAFRFRVSEIADILGTTEMAIKSILHRSKKRIDNKGSNGAEIIWEKEEENLLSELFYNSLTQQDPTILIRFIPTIHCLMKETVPAFPSKTLSPLGGLYMAA